MIQLALVGPPAEPSAPTGRRRLHRLVYDAIFTHFADLGLDPLQIDGAAHAVVERLSGLPDVRPATRHADGATHG
jgi:hypothetical protein